MTNSRFLTHLRQPLLSFPSPYFSFLGNTKHNTNRLGIETPGHWLRQPKNHRYSEDPATTEI